MIDCPGALDWTQRYMRIPFVDEGRGFDGADCYGLCWLAWREERGVTLPDALIYGSTDVENTEALNAAIASRRPDFVAVEDPEPFALVLFRCEGRPVHIGLCVGQGYFLHTDSGTGVMLDELTARRWSRRIEGFYAPR
ncbi:C40 family peptidase [Hyphobacterium sp.]|uniref:C40 family peptidase n=1 Tax=Hyphobacterium sp. TaxID=2004662 RepID=UPI003B52738F